MKNSLQTFTAMLMMVVFIGGCNKDTVKAPSKTITRGEQSNSVGSVTVSPASDIVFSAVTITGSNFSTTAANNVVKFNGVLAVVNSATANQIVVTVPLGATTGKVTVIANGATSTSSNNFQVLQMVKVDSTNIANTFAQKGYGASLSTGDKNGNLYGLGMLNNGENRYFVFKYSNGVASRLYTTPPSNGFYTLKSLVIDAQGNVYVAKNFIIYGRGIATVDSAEILKITPGGQVSVLAGGNPGINDSNSGNAITAIAVNCMVTDGQGNLYASVYNSDQSYGLKKITPDGVVTPVSGFNVGDASVMITDRLGDLFYETSAQSSTSPTNSVFNLEKRGPNGAISTIFSQNNPFTIVTDAFNNVFASVDYSTAQAEVENVYVIQANAVNVLPSPNGPAYPFSVMADINGNFLTVYPWGLITVWKFE